MDLLNWIFGALDFPFLKEVIGAAFHWQVTQFTIAFILAWKTVRGDMKKEIAEQFTHVVNSINAVVEELSQVKTKLAEDLNATGKRLGNLEDGVSELRSEIKTIRGTVEHLTPRT